MISAVFDVVGLKSFCVRFFWDPPFAISSSNPAALTHHFFSGPVTYNFYCYDGYEYCLSCILYIVSVSNHRAYLESIPSLLSSRKRQTNKQAAKQTNTKKKRKKKNEHLNCEFCFIQWKNNPSWECIRAVMPTGDLRSEFFRASSPITSARRRIEARHTLSFVSLY